MRAYWNLKIGSGISAATAGRIHPTAYLGLDIDTFGLSITSVGFKNTLSYMSSYQVNMFALARKEIFELGLGLGLYSYELGYKENQDDGGVKSHNFAAGPAVRSFIYLGPLFLGIEAMYGLRPKYIGAHILLSSQDMATFTLGVNF